MGVFCRHTLGAVDRCWSLNDGTYDGRRGDDSTRSPNSAVSKRELLLIAAVTATNGPGSGSVFTKLWDTRA